MKFDKIIAISSKKQITLPKKVYEELGFTDQVRLVVDDDNSIKLFPVIKEKKSNVLEELIKKGLSGEELLKEFKKREEKE
jgi:bifunctional DNA-binding transcriptional regulator/antitoxin component of YhaV-PrlF toxin-antitoxin module